MSAWAIVSGLMMGVGLTLMLTSTPSFQRDLRTRIAPYVADVSAGAFNYLERQRADHTARWTIAGVAQGLIERFGPAKTELEQLMRRAGQSGGADHLRLQLLTALLVGFGGGVGFALLSGAPLMIRLALPFLAATASVWVRLLLVRRRARHRADRIARELPAVLEFMSLSVTSGEALPDAINRVANIASGDAAGEFAEVMRRNSLGAPLVESLARMDTELNIPAVTRLVTHLTAALERGSPIADVLRAQCEDQRVELKRQLLESGGKKEIAMMLPLVFLILPVTVVFAVWPGLMSFNAGV